MLISDTRKFIFIHIYKNAGTSIINALAPFATSQFPAHMKAPEIINAIGREAFDSYFSFAIVRNPWDWQVSLYNYMLKNPIHRQHELVKALGRFDKYIRWRCEEEVRFQKDFIYSSDNQLLVDFVGRFELLDADFQSICSRVGISTSLPKLNVSNENPYQEYYTDETRELVRRTFDADITLFGYDF